MDTQAVVLQLRYSAWATRRVLESTLELSPDELNRDLSNSFGSIQGTLTHIFQGDSIWFDRLMGTPTRNLGAYEPAPDFAQFSKNWLALLDRYVSWAEGLKPGEWDRIVHYRFINGDAGQQPVWQLALHIVNHATYHRGQIITMLRQLGRTPIGTDLITYYRSMSTAAAKV